MIFAGSCQQENLEPVAQGNTVTYTVELPEIATKAIGDGLNVDELIYEVWKTEAPDQRDLVTEGNAIRLYQDKTSLVERDGIRKAVVTLNLVQDQEYTILFWAQVKGTGVYNTEYLTDVHYATGFKPGESGYYSNQESYAAFYAADFVSDQDPKSKTVVLKRPFAQLNIATVNTPTDYTVTVNKSRVVIENVATRFNVAMNLPESPAVDGFSKIEFKNADVPSDPATLTVNNQTYEYVAMNYIFANGTTEVSYEINTTLTSKEGTSSVAGKVSNNVPNVPLKENYRTNIVGNLLTSTTDYTVEIDANWADTGDGGFVEVWDGKNIMEPKKNTKGEYEIYLATELAWVAAAVNGTIVDPEMNVTKTTGYETARTFADETFVLMADIDLKNSVLVPIGATGSFHGTFDGNGHVISNLNVNINDIKRNVADIDHKFGYTIPVGLFGRVQGVVKNVDVDGAAIVGHYKAAVIVGEALCGEIENCKAMNATVTITPYDNDNGNHAGAIAGYLAADGGNAHVINSAAINVTVKAYRDVAALVGTTTYNGNFAPVVTGNVIENAVVIADQTAEYDEVKAANAGYFVGRKSSNTVLEHNDYTDVEVKVIGGSDSDVKAAIANAKDGDTVYFAGTYGTFPAVGKAITVVCEEGTVFQGKSGLSLNPEAVVIGATFSNPSGTAVAGTITGTFKNCTFTGSNALRSCYAGETCYFEDCVFDGSTYGVHFDGGTDKNIYFKNCVLSGFNAFAAAINLVTFDGCTFKANGKSIYNGANLWGSAKFINTEFLFDGSVGNEWIDAIGTDKTYEFTGCNINGSSLFQGGYIFSRNAGTKMTIDGELYTYAEGGYFIAPDGTAIVTTAAALENAAAKEVSIFVADDLNGDVTIAQKPDFNVTIDGNNKMYNGLIVVDGKSATYATAGLTIKNLTFNAEAISADACIRLGDGTNDTRYTCNVTVENCTFEVPGAVGVKSYTGGDKNLTITGCTATAKAHSLVQAKGIDGILVQRCTVKSKNGMNFNNSTNVTVDNCTADVKGYAARFGESSGGTGAAEVYEIKNSTLKSACEDGDAVIILRGTADYSTLTITNTTLEGATLVQNTATDAKVVIDGRD